MLFIKTNKQQLMQTTRPKPAAGLPVLQHARCLKAAVKMNRPTANGLEQTYTPNQTNVLLRLYR